MPAIAPDEDPPQRPSRRFPTVTDPEEAAALDPDPIAVRIEFAIRRKARPWKGVIVTIAITALGALGGAFKSMIDSERAAERDKVRLEILESEVRILRAAVFRSSLSMRGDVPDQPAPPATKGTP